MPPLPSLQVLALSMPVWLTMQAGISSSLYVSSPGDIFTTYSPTIKLVRFYLALSKDASKYFPTPYSLLLKNFSGSRPINVVWLWKDERNPC